MYYLLVVLGFFGGVYGVATHPEHQWSVTAFACSYILFVWIVWGIPDQESAE